MENDGNQSKGIRRIERKSYHCNSPNQESVKESDGDSGNADSSGPTDESDGGSEIWRAAGSLETIAGFDFEENADGKAPPGGGNEPVGLYKKFVQQFGGITLTLMASMMSSTNLILVKTLQKRGMGAPELTCFGYSGAFIPSIFLMLFSEWHVKTTKRKIVPTEIEDPNQKESVQPTSMFEVIWPLNIPARRNNMIGLVILSFIAAWCILFRFFALRFITVGDTAVISIGAPVIVTILAHFTLGEKTGLIPILMAILSLIGVAIISRPPILTGKDRFDAQTLIGTLFALSSMGCAAILMLICRKIRDVHFSLQMMGCGALGMIMPALVAIWLNHGTFSLPKDWTEILMTLIVSMFGFGVSLFMVLALKIEKAGVVSLTRTCDVLFGFILQFVFFHVEPDIYSSIGGIIICCGVLVTALRKYIETLPRGSLSGWRQHLATCCCTENAQKTQHIYSESK